MKEKGFTLIELLVAMTIIAVLSGMALVSYQGARKTARDGKRKTDLEQIRSALEMYRTDEDTYPEVAGDVSSVLSSPLSGYLAIPSDPLPNRFYSYSGTANSYTLCAYLEIDSGTDCNYAVADPGSSANIANCVSCVSAAAPTPPTPPPTPPTLPTPPSPWRCIYFQPPMCTVQIGTSFPDQNLCFANCPGLAGPCPWSCNPL